MWGMHEEAFDIFLVNIRASHNNVPEYLESTQNAVRIFKMSPYVLLPLLR